MRSKPWLIACAVLVMALTGLARSADPPQVATTNQSIRAVWVLRSTLTSPESVRSMVKMVSSAGFNTVLLQVRGRGEAFYTSAVDPRASGLPDDFDPLALAIGLGHEAGLAVHAWVNVNLVASAAALPRSSQHVVRRHPEWLMVPRELADALSKIAPRLPRLPRGTCPVDPARSRRGRGPVRVACID